MSVINKKTLFISMLFGLFFAVNALAAGGVGDTYYYKMMLMPLSDDGKTVKGSYSFTLECDNARGTKTIVANDGQPLDNSVITADYNQPLCPKALAFIDVTGQSSIKCNNGQLFGGSQDAVNPTVISFDGKSSTCTVSGAVNK